VVVTAGVRRYAVWQGLISTWFWVPVFFLYFTGELGLDGALVLEAVYYLAVAVAEVPSGYFSDRLGRRVTLVLSSGWFILAYAAFWWGGEPWVFVVAQILLALGVSFKSGTDTAYHLELLEMVALRSEFKEREARLARMRLTAGAGGAVLGGLAGVWALSAAYGLACGAATVALMVAWSLPQSSPLNERAQGPRQQLGAVFNAIRRRSDGGPPLGWLFGVSVLAVALAHVPYQLYQPYLNLVALSTVDMPTSLLTGVHAAFALLIAAPMAGASAKLARLLGLRRLLLLALIAQVCVIGLMAIMVHPAVAVLLALRSVPMAVVRSPLDAAVAVEVPAALRATYLSVQSLAGRLAYAIVLGVMSAVVGRASDAASIAQLAMLAVLGGLCAWVVLASLGRRGQHPGVNEGDA
jgi:MFS family permease